MRLSLLALFGAVCVAVSGCHSESPTANLSPGDLLKWSMDQHAKLASYQANYNWTAKYKGMGARDLSEARFIAYQSPNLFKVSSKSNGITLYCICDGSKMVIATSDPKSKPESFAAPVSIASANSVVMNEPIYCGSLLYTCFGGAPHYNDLVDESKSKPSFGSEESVNGEKSRHVRFYAAGPYGHADILVGETTGNIYRIAYDSEPLLQRLAAARAQKHSNSPIPSASSTVEDYSQIQNDPTLGSEAFQYTPPKGIRVVDMSDPNNPPPPVQLGDPAPNVTLRTLDGRPVKLSSLRGKTVLIDFWATWCGPCKQSLPHTEDLYKKYRNHGLEVVTVSDEDTQKIAGFVSSNHYTFPTYRDAGNQVARAYNVTGLPTFVIIDKSGNLSNYFVGYRPEETILAALKSAGVG